MMQKKNIALLTIVVLASAAVWLQSSQTKLQDHKQRVLTDITTYNTNPTRSTTVTTYCDANLDRSQLVDNTQKETAQGYKDTLASTFSINGNNLINLLVAGNSDDAVTEIQTDSTALGIFVGVFFLGLIILLLIWAFLLCCCCCPSCCPSKCCQKDDNEQYTKCELYWPSIFLIVCLLLVIVTSAIGLASASGFKDGLDDSACATAIMMDDIINGNVTSDGSKFFVGITVLIQEINALSGNITDISGNMSRLTGATMTATVNNVTTAKTDVRKVPNNADADGNASISYTTAFNETYSSSNPTITSLVSTVLGSSNNGGIIGGLFTTMQTLETTLSGIESTSSTFTSSTAAFQTALASTTSSLNDFQSSVDSFDGEISNTLSTMDPARENGTMVVQLFYGVALGFATLAMIGVVLMTFCDKYKCRYLMYFACVVLFLFALIGFLISAIFSIIVPLMYWSCDWLTVTTGSASGFNTNMADVADADTRAYVSVCLDGETGDIVNSVSPTTATTLNNLRDSVSNVSIFNSSSEIDSMNSAISSIQSVIDDFNNGNTPDITDADAIATLVTVSNPGNFNSGCSAIDSDSWVVSHGNTSYTSCQITASNVSSSSGTCTARGDISGDTCVGCIDSTSIFNAYYTAVARGGLKSDLDTKYGVGGTPACGTFTTYFGNIWDNYYFVKIPAVTSINTRFGTATTSINQVITDLGTINTTFTEVIGNLTATVDSITDPTYGLIAGLNCLIIGEDIETFVSSVCVSNFNTIYLNRLVMGISSFGILFALCCIVFSGVRHLKHSERKDKISPNFDRKEKNSFEDTDAAFRPIG